MEIKTNYFQKQKIVSLILFSLPILISISVLFLLSLSQKNELEQQIKSILMNDKIYSKGEGLFSLAESYEAQGEWDKAVKIYQAVIDNIYDERTEGPVGQLYGFLAEQKIEWIKSDKSWYFQDREELVRKIKESLENGNADELIKYACRGCFEIGYAESDIIYIEDIKEVRRLLKENLKNSIVRVEEINRDYGKYKRKEYLGLRTVGWQPTDEDFTEEVTLELHKDERGWQWDGIMFSYGHANWKEFLNWLEERLKINPFIYEEEKIYKYIEKYYVFNREKAGNILDLLLKRVGRLKDPGKAYYLLGEIFAVGDRAEEMFEKVISHYKNSSIYTDAKKRLSYLKENSSVPLEALEYYIKGKQCMTRGYFREAIRQFGHLLQKYPESQLAGEVQFLLAKCYFSREEFIKAREEFKKFLEKYKNATDINGNLLAPFALLFIANSFHNENNYSEALSAYRKVIELYPDYEISFKNGLVFSPAKQAQHFMAMVYYLMRDYENSISIFQTFSEIKDNHVVVPYHWAKFYCGDNPFSCNCHISESLKAKAMVELAELYYGYGNPEKAISLYAEILMDKDLRVKMEYELNNEKNRKKTYFEIALSQVAQIENPKYKGKIIDLFNSLVQQSLTENQSLLLYKYCFKFLLRQREHLSGFQKWIYYIKKCDENGIKDIDIWVYEHKKIDSVILEMDRNYVEVVMRFINENIQNIKEKEIRGYLIYLQAISFEKILKENKKALIRYKEAVKLLKGSKQFWLYIKLANGKIKLLNKKI